MSQTNVTKSSEVNGWWCVGLHPFGPVIRYPKVIMTEGHIFMALWPYLFTFENTAALYGQPQGR